MKIHDNYIDEHSYHQNFCYIAKLLPSFNILSFRSIFTRLFIEIYYFNLSSISSKAYSFFPPFFFSFQLLRCILDRVQKTRHIVMSVCITTQFADPMKRFMQIYNHFYVLVTNIRKASKTTGDILLVILALPNNSCIHVYLPIPLMCIKVSKSSVHVYAAGHTLQLPTTYPAQNTVIATPGNYFEHTNFNLSFCPRSNALLIFHRRLLFLYQFIYPEIDRVTSI